MGNVCASLWNEGKNREFLGMISKEEIDPADFTAFWENLNRSERKKVLDVKLNGLTMAHLLAAKGMLPEDAITDELLRRKGPQNMTVAHMLASTTGIPVRFLTEDLLLMKEDHGVCVAAVQAAFHDFPVRFMTLEILYTDVPEGMIGDKKTVQEILQERGLYPASWGDARLEIINEGPIMEAAKQMFYNEFPNDAEKLIAIYEGDEEAEKRAREKERLRREGKLKQPEPKPKKKGFFSFFER